METTVKQAKNILDKILEFRLTGGNPPPVILWEAPGIGKSDIVKSIALERGLELQDIRLAQLDPVDLRGLPFGAMNTVMRFSGIFISAIIP